MKPAWSRTPLRPTTCARATDRSSIHQVESSLDLPWRRCVSSRRSSRTTCSSSASSGAFMFRYAVAFSAAFALMSAASSVRADDVVVINEPLVTASATPLADALAREAATLAADPQDTRPVAIEYSEGHETRAKIHKYASWATLPLIGTEFWLGQRLYDNPSSDDS